LVDFEQVGGGEGLIQDINRGIPTEFSFRGKNFKAPDLSWISFSGDPDFSRTYKK
jgi:hypothetical protein